MSPSDGTLGTGNCHTSLQTLAPTKYQRIQFAAASADRNHNVIGEYGLSTLVVRWTLFLKGLNAFFVILALP
jgi:hypothetical protein